MINTIKNIAILSAVAFLMAGCSGKDSILVPGQNESDCEGKAANLGVCATPKNAYKYKDRIGKVYFEDDQGYYVNKNGKIFNVETNEEVIPGQKPNDCGEAVCVNCDEDEASECGTGGSGYSDSIKRKNRIKLNGRSLMVKTPQKTTMIRDMGWQQKIWIAPLETNGDDLVEAHGVHVVIKKPSWIIGEKVPKNVNRGVVIPSVLAVEAITDNHQAISRKTNSAIYDYVQEKKSSEYPALKSYVDTKAKK